MPKSSGFVSGGLQRFVFPKKHTQTTVFAEKLKIMFFMILKFSMICPTPPHRTPLHPTPLPLPPFVGWGGGLSREHFGESA